MAIFYQGTSNILYDMEPFYTVLYLYEKQIDVEIVNLDATAYVSSQNLVGIEKSECLGRTNSILEENKHFPVGPSIYTKDAL